MKGFIISIAIFASLMLTIPLIAMGNSSNVQQNPTKNSKISDIINKNEKFKILNVKTGKVEEIGAVDYVCGVVAAEMPYTFHTEALKAQAVASFTYAVYRREYNLKHPGSIPEHKGADLCTDSHHCKAYASIDELKAKWGANFNRNYQKIYDAVLSVANKTAEYKGEPIVAVFCSMSSGTTESSKDVWGTDLPYLVEVASDGDKLTPGFETTVKLSQNDVKSKITEQYKDAVFNADPSKWITDIKRSAAGGVVTADVCGKVLKGETIRNLFGLRSANFTVAYQKDNFTFDVKGYGHGVGMSQHGADYMAGQGKSYQDIIKWYYKGVDIEDYKWSNTAK